MSTPKKRTTAGKSAGRRAAKTRQVDIRMYNVGFGDCFLLHLPTEDGVRRMLVDCGYHSQGKGPFTDAELVAQIAEDLEGEGLDVVVATHRHQDHISGFGETEAWKGIPVEEVWLPFTAHPDAATEDPALKAWEGLLAAADSLFVNGKLSDAAASALAAHGPEEREAVEFMLWNARANKPGIDNLREGMRRRDGRPARRIYLPAGKVFPSTLDSAALPGVTIHVLGPPRDPALRKSRKVPAGWGVADPNRPSWAGGEIECPFGPEWRVKPQDVPSSLPFSSRTLSSIRGFNEGLAHAAKAAEGFLNGESLVLVVEVGQARILLPGDAEVGAWTAILENPDALAIAASATFLKVGHHGSHNATPLVFLREQLAAETPAMISTQEGTGSFRNGIPLQEILKTLDARRMSFVRSDAPPSKREGIFTPSPDGRWVDGKIPC